MTSSRKYELKKRAAEMAETRRRITEAAVELHGTIGPARTTVSAVAARAGVQRHTVYRHFPTDDDLLQACSAHYMEQNPLPDLGPWSGIADPRERLQVALNQLYAYYEGTEPMFSNVVRDAELVDSVRRALEPLEEYHTEAVEILAVGWPTRGRRRSVLRAALHHAVDFTTWRSLASGGRVTREDAVQLLAALVESAAAPRTGATRGSS